MEKRNQSPTNGQPAASFGECANSCNGNIFGQAALFSSSVALGKPDGGLKAVDASKSSEGAVSPSNVQPASLFGGFANNNSSGNIFGQVPDFGSNNIERPSYGSRSSKIVGNGLKGLDFKDICNPNFKGYNGVIPLNAQQGNFASPLKDVVEGSENSGVAAVSPISENPVVSFDKFGELAKLIQQPSAQGQVKARKYKRKKVVSSYKPSPIVNNKFPIAATPPSSKFFSFAVPSGPSPIHPSFYPNHSRQSMFPPPKSGE